MNRTPVAFFDFDGTLTRGDTLLPFLRFVAGAPRFYAGMAFLSPVLAAYGLKLLRNDIAKQKVLRHFLAGYSADGLLRQGERFNHERLPSLLHPVGMERLAWHRSAGHDYVLVSASLESYLKHWSRSQGFAGLIASSLATDSQGKVTGQLYGGNCFGEEKTRRIVQWLAAENREPETIFAYGNSRGDYSMLAFAKRGFLLKKSRLIDFSIHQK